MTGKPESQLTACEASHRGTPSPTLPPGGGGKGWRGELKSEIRNLKWIGGFTLIEILVFIVIAGILLPAIIVPFATAVKGSTKPERVTTAMYLAHYRMEELTKFAYGNGALNPGALTPYANTPIPTYQWQWQITYVDSDFNASVPDLGYKRILVRVRDPENATYEINSVVTDFP